LSSRPLDGPRRQVLLVLAWTLAAGLAVLAVVRAFGVERGTAMALLVGALPLTLLPAHLLLALAVLWRRRLLSAVCLGLVVAHALVLAPALGAEPLPPAAASAPRLRVVVSNLYLLNPDPAEAGRALRRLDPDVVVVPELDTRGLSGLRRSGLLDDLPHVVVELGAREETVGLLSRLPLEDVTTRPVGGRELPRATVEVDGTPVRLLAEHTLPPLSVFEVMWRDALTDLAREVRAVDTPAVVLGDFNADRDHAPFRRLLDTGLRDAHDERGRGLARTFPAWLPVLHLDHVLVRDGARARLVVRDVREVRLPGSDHRTVVADLALLRAG
jgi:endonuclease/exonuclease/phosphatase (EEP) superfamily protein YafD